MTERAGKSRQDASRQECFVAGSINETVEGRYTATFAGQAFVTADQDDGSFLSDESFDNYYDRSYLPGAGSPPPRRNLLDLSDLFPAEFQERKVKFKICVEVELADQ